MVVGTFDVVKLYVFISSEMFTLDVTFNTGGESLYKLEPL